MNRYFMTVALAVAAMGVTSANADTLKINTITQTHANAPKATIYDGQLNGGREYVNVTPFNITGTLNGDAVSLFAYCVDIFQNTATGDFTVMSLTDYVGADRARLIGNLVSANPLAGTAAQDAAMQAAIWEVVNEKKFTDIGNVFKNSGLDFRIDFDGSSTAIETSTNSLLANALATKAGDPSLNFFVAKSNKGQDMLFWTKSTPAVPEPATWAMMIVGMGAVGASLRRRSANVQFA